MTPSAVAVVRNDPGASYEVPWLGPRADEMPNLKNKAKRCRPTVPRGGGLYGSAAV